MLGYLNVQRLQNYQKLILKVSGRRRIVLEDVENILTNFLIENYCFNSFLKYIRNNHDTTCIKDYIERIACFNKVARGCNKINRRVITDSSLITCAFSFKNTPEGESYWLNISEMWSNKINSVEQGCCCNFKSIW